MEVKNAFVRVIVLLVCVLLCSSPVLSEDIEILVCPEGCGILVSDLYISKEVKNIDPGIVFKPVDRRLPLQPAGNGEKQRQVEKLNFCLQR